jgi:carboxymethylenebutenolidase
MNTALYYMALPKVGKGPGVLVLHSWWGLNAFFKDLCDRFADAGFVALAPDLYDGRVASTVAAAKKLRAEATASRRVPAYKLLIAAIDQLSGHEATIGQRIAVVGFSNGRALGVVARPTVGTSYYINSGLLCCTQR